MSRDRKNKSIFLNESETSPKTIETSTVIKEKENNEEVITENNLDNLWVVFDFIKQFEWFRETAYRDYSQRSIWYWTKSHKWEVITEEEARKRKIEYVKNDFKKYNLKDKPLNIQKAVISFVYNVGWLNKNQKRLLDNWYYCALGNSFSLYVYAGNDYLPWLDRRRQAERKLLCE